MSRPPSSGHEPACWLAEVLAVASSSVSEDAEAVTVVEVLERLARLERDAEDTATTFGLERKALTRRRQTHPFWPLMQPRGT